MLSLKQLVETIEAYETVVYQHNSHIKHSVVLNPPASAQAIATLEKHIGFTLTDNLKALYLFSNGIRFRIYGQELVLNSLQEAQELLTWVQNLYDTPLLSRVFPLINDNSFVWIMLCEAPLKNYLVHGGKGLPWQLKYRSLDSFFAALRWHILPWLKMPDYDHNDENTCRNKDYYNHGAIDLSTMPCDMDFYARTGHEYIAARQLLAMADRMNATTEKSNILEIAMTLMTEGEIDQLKLWLHGDDKMYSWVAFYRLMQMNSAEARSILAEFKRSG